MTEFTKEKINELRKQLEVFHIDSNPVQEMQVVTTMRKSLDEIQRLQARVQELEEQQRNDLRLSVMSVEEFERQMERIAELEAERRWIPVSERLPNREDGVSYGGVVYCLIYLLSYNVILQASYYPKMGVWNMPNGYEDDCCDITHWKKQSNRPMEDSCSG